MRGSSTTSSARLLDAIAGKPVAEVDGADVNVTPGPRTSGGPSIAWGGQSTAAARRAARFGLDFFAQTDGDDLAAAYHDECEKQGHPPGNLVLPSPDTPSTIFVADDIDRAWDELGSYLLHDATTYAAWNPQGNTASLSYGKTVDELRAENGAHRVWTVDEAVDWVRQNGYLGLHPLCGGVPPEIAWPYLRRVVDEVMPALAIS